MPTFTNSTGLAIPDEPAAAGITPIPVNQTVSVSGLSGVITNLTISITLSSPFPDDLDFLLVAPDGSSNLLFWSDAGGTLDLVTATITIADAGSTVLSDTSTPGIINGNTYRPADYTSFVNETGPYFGLGAGFTVNHATTVGSATLASSFNNLAPNGTWTLYVTDDENGDVSSISSWSLNITTAANPPVITNLNGDVASFTEGGAAVLLDVSSNATVTDPDSLNFDTGNVTVSITNNRVAAEDVLSIQNQGTGAGQIGVSGSNVSFGGATIGTFAGGTGTSDLVVTLNANATPAAVQALVRALTYSNTNSVGPNVNARTVSVTVNDGDGDTSAVSDVTVNVAATGDDPMTSFVNNTGVTVPDNAVTNQTILVSGLSGNITDVSLTITGLTHTNPQDLDFLLVGPDNVHNLLFLADAGGIPDISGVTVTIADFGGAQSPIGGPLVAGTFKPADYAPDTEANNAFGPTFTINHAGPTGSALFSSAFNGTAPNGTWTLYIRDDEGADVGSFTSWTLNIATDGGAPVNSAPVISGLNTDTFIFTEGGTAARLDVGPTATVTDGDSTDFDTGNLTVSITANEFATEDVLGIDTAGTGVTLSAGMTVGSVVSVSGTDIGTITSNGAAGNDLVVTFNSSANATNVTSLVRALTYLNTNTANPNINPRTVAVTINDGDGGTSSAANVTVNVAATDDETMTTFTNPTGSGPIPDGPAGAAFSQTINVSGLGGDVVDVSITITGLTTSNPDDLDFLLVGPDGVHNLEFWSDVGGNLDITNLTFTIADFGTSTLSDNGPLAAGTLRAADYTITEANSFFGPTFTINHPTGNGGIATFASAFAGITPNGNWTLYVRDDEAADIASFTSWSLSIATSGVAPTATELTQTQAYTEGGATVALNDIVVTDPDVGDTITATLTLNSPAAGVLTTSGTATYTPGTGVWTITGTVAEVNTALAAVSFTPATQNDVDTTITTHIEDAAASGPADGTITLDVTPVADPPTATNLAQTKTYTEDDPTVALDDIVVTEFDTGDTITATLTLNNPATGALTTSGTATYTAGTGVWTITGTLVQVNAALAAVSFTPATQNDVDTTITTHIQDAAASGPADGAITLDVTPVADAPTATNLTQAKTYTEGDATVALDDIAVTEFDTGDTITATLTLNNPAAGVLTTSGTATYTAGTGVWTITGTLAEVNTALAAVSFTPATQNDVDTTITTHIQDAAASGPADGTITLDVTPVADPPTATNLTQAKTYTEGDATVALDDIVVTDVDTGETITATLTLNNPAAGVLTTSGTATYAPGTGVWTITGTVTEVNTALAAVSFTSATQNDVDTTITTHIQDAAASGPADGTITLDVTPVADPPTATNLTQAKTYTEGGATVALDDIAVTDVDTGETITARLTLNNPAAGVLTTSGTATYTPGTGVWTITGTLAQVNAALAAVSFTPATDNDVDTTITTHIEDAAASGPADGTITLDVTPVADPPTATNLTQAKTYTEGDATVALDDIAVTDVDTGETITARLTLNNPAAGVLTTSGTATYTPGTGVWTITGTLAQVNAALAAVSFTPATQNDVDTTITTHIEDAAASGPADGTITLDVTPVADAPTATNLAQTKTYTEDDPTVALDDIVVTEFDTGDTITATLTLNNPATGALTTSGTATYTAGTGVWTITDTLSNVNAALAAVSFTPATHNDVDTTITTHIQDAAATGPADGTITLDATPVNDAPVNTVPGAQVVDEDTGLPITGLSIADVDSGAGVMTTTLSVVNGILIIDPAAGAAVDGSETNTVTLTGTLAQINATLAAAGGVIYTAAENFNGGDTLTMTTNDGGNTGLDPGLTGNGTSEQDSDTVGITINALNDGPVNILPVSASAVPDQNRALTGLAVADVDAAGGVLSTMLHVDNGILTAASAGGAGVAGSGTDTVTLTGTLAQINATLSAAGNVVYNSDTGFTGTDTLTMTTNDGGNTGLGGPLFDTDTMSIEVRTSVNKNDFNGDGKSDILWRHESGPLASWELDGGTILHYHFLGGVDPSYSVDAVADFDGNGTADILWRHDSGFIITWDINHGDQTGYHAIGPTNPADVIEGTGDFNGDGHAEILWRNADTGVVSWQLNTGPFVDGDVDGDEIQLIRDYGPVTSDWNIAGIGDVNGDGNSDIFWRHDSGQLVSWEVDDGAIIGFHDYGHVGNDYTFIETGDFNGDGKSGDIVWRHVGGQVVTWELDGGTQIGYHDFGVVTNDYTIEDTGDYNGDGRSDILWRHDSGLPITWELDGGSIIGYHAFPVVDPVWQVQP